MRYLLDGYNFLFTVGFHDPRLPRALEKGRIKLLAYLLEHLPDPNQVHIVFDARESPIRDEPFRIHQGMQISFTLECDADELIEDLIAEDPQPRQLTVISNDQRLQVAGKRRRCRVWDCGTFLDWLAFARVKPHEADQPVELGKPEVIPAEEVAYWLREFDPDKTR